MQKTRYRRLLSIFISFVMMTSFSGQVLAESGLSLAPVQTNDEDLLSLVGSEEGENLPAGGEQTEGEPLQETDDALLPEPTPVPEEAGEAAGDSPDQGAPAEDAPDQNPPAEETPSPENGAGEAPAESLPELVDDGSPEWTEEEPAGTEDGWETIDAESDSLSGAAAAAPTEQEAPAGAAAPADDAAGPETGGNAYRSIEAELEAVPLLDAEHAPTETDLRLGSIWPWLFGRELQADPAAVAGGMENPAGDAELFYHWYDDAYVQEHAAEYAEMYAGSEYTKKDLQPIAIEISGSLPEDVTARGYYVNLREDLNSGNPEAALIAMDLALYDGQGQLYTPAEPLRISVNGLLLHEAAALAQPFLVYAYEENADREVQSGAFAADVTVYRDQPASLTEGDPEENAEKEAALKGRLQYTADAAEGAVRFTEDPEGLLYDEQAALCFETAAAPLHFVLSVLLPVEETDSAIDPEEDASGEEPALVGDGQGEGNGSVSLAFMDGGTLVDTVRLEPGQPVGDSLAAVRDPAREHCDFAGWYTRADGGEQVTADTVFSENATLYARYTVTLRFSAEGVKAPEDLVVFEGTAAGSLPTPAREGYRFAGWYTDSAFKNEVTAETTFSAHTTLYGRFAGQVRLHFHVSGREPVSRSVDKGTAIGEDTLYVEEALKEGCTLGWYTEDGTPVTAASSFNSDTDLYARYTITVTFLVKSGDYKEVTSEHRLVLALPEEGEAQLGDRLLEEPVLTGYQFKGWFRMGEDGLPGPEQVTGETWLSAHTTLVAKLVKQVTITFMTNGIRHEFTEDTGSRIPLLENPIRSGSRFDGWFDIGEDADDDSDDRQVTTSEGLVDENGRLLTDEQGHPVRTLTATEDMTLTARFIDQITVRFLIAHPVNKSSSGTPSLDTHKTVTLDKTEDGLAVSSFPDDPILSGYEFQGWYGIRKYDGADRYSDIPEDQREGIFVLDKNIDGTPYVADESAPVDAQTVFTESVDVVAKFTRTLNITFQYDSGEGYRIETKKTLISTNLYGYAPEEAKKDGYRVVWYKDGDPVPEDYILNEKDDNKVVVAHYIEQVTLTFKADGQEDIVLAIDKGTAVSSSGKAWPADPAAQGKLRFIGWYDADNKKVDQDTIIVSDVTLTSKFGYQVTFVADHEDGTEPQLVETRYVEAEEALSRLPGDPFWEGHRFKCWKNESGSEVDEAYVIDHEQTITGYFEEIEVYTVVLHYIIDGASSPVDTKIVSVDKSAVSAENPMTVASPTSFRQSGAVYYPVMQAIRLVPGGNEAETDLVVEDSHSEVTMTNDADGNGEADVDDDGNKQFTVVVPYKEANAKYTVRYMLLNLNGNANSYETDYTEIGGESVSLEGVIGAEVSPAVKEFVYAELQKVEPKTIEHAEGDVFNVYYTRKRFSLIYETNGGQGMDSVSGLYGTKITLASPVREGYTFTGWYLDKALKTSANATLTLKRDTVVYAGWKADKVSYTIVYFFEKFNDAGTSPEYVYDNSETKQAIVGSVVKADDVPALNRKGWEKDSTKNSSSSVTISADGSSVLYVYYKLTEYTFYFKPGSYDTYEYYGYYGYYVSYDVTATLKGDTKTGNNPFAYTMKVKLGQGIGSTWPTFVTNAYFGNGGWNSSLTFYGWQHPFNNTIYVTKRLTVTDDMIPDTGSVITYSAQWLQDTEAYTVNYWLQNANDDGYTKSEEYSQTLYSTKGGINLGAKDITGYTYNSNKDAHVYTGYGLSRYITIYNFYYDRNTFKIDYYCGGIKLSTISSIKFDANISKSPYKWKPTASQCGVDEDYSYCGWYIDSKLTSPYTFDKMPASNLVLYAKWVRPEYKVTFHLNYEGAAPEPYLEWTVLKGEIATKDMGEEELNKLAYPTAPEKMTFVGWSASSEAYDPIDPANKRITANTQIYAWWKPTEITEYMVYYQDASGKNLLDPVKKHGRWPLGEEVTETAPYIAGYTEEDETLIADAGTKTLVLGSNPEENKIVFIYSKKPEKINYTIHYVLWEDPSVKVAESKSGSVGGDYISVTETAAKPTAEAYQDYSPTELTHTWALGSDEDQNVFTFYYTKGEKITVSYLDMEGDPLPGKARMITYEAAGADFILETGLNGYTLDHIEVDGERTDQTVFKLTDNLGSIGIQVYYRYNLSILARSLSRQYDGEPLSDAGVYTDAQEIAKRIRAAGLKEGHVISGLTITGSQTDYGVCPSTPSDAVITGADGSAVDPDRFYNITYSAGSLYVTKVNVIISLEPDRWTKNIYDDTVRKTGFTNDSKTIGDYIRISDRKFKETYLQAIWDRLMEKLRTDHPDFEIVENALKRTKGDKEPTVDGLAVITGKKDAGDYYEPASTFEAALTAVLADESLHIDQNYNIIHYVRECRLEILPKPVQITTAGSEQIYNGSELTVSGLTVTDSKGEIKPETGTNQYDLAGDDVVTIKAVGSQTHPGRSQNIYEIDWGNVRQENYSISETLGTLIVDRKKIAITAVDLVKAYGDPDPEWSVRVTWHDEEKDLEREIPATLTQWTGNSYTLKLKDREHGYVDNIPFIMSREEGEAPGTYAITPEADSTAESKYKYEIHFQPGTLSIAIARVSADRGTSWSYHAYLLNDAYTQGEDPIRQGAFNRALETDGDVIVETMCETAEEAGTDRYALTRTVDLRGSAPTSLTLRTMPGKPFRSVISRGFTEGSLFVTDRSFTLADLILDGKQMSCTASGGAVHVCSGGILNLKNRNRITGNTVDGEGAGIYLEEGGTLNLEGQPEFAENFKDETLTAQANGGAPYDRPRQDIYLAGYIGTDGDGNPKPAVSLRVTGRIDLDEGSIWVWPEAPSEDTENNHYKQQKQFAILALPEGNELSEEEKAASVRVFRNAVPDELTEAAEPLYGQLGDEDETNPNTNIYWSGVTGYRRVILRKVDGNTYTSLEGAAFNLYKGSSSTPYVWRDRNHKETALEMNEENLVSGTSGVIWIGELPYGTYYLQETKAPKDPEHNAASAYSGNVNTWFCLIVDETGTHMSGGEASRALALDSLQ